jgi:bifunctional DNA-binding transcriptional regulator/antitoxin component of YhaV-PrlF toxin-antitoxin module
MSEINLLKTDSRGRVTLPPPFRKEPLFEYLIEGEQIILYPVRTVRKFPDMSGLQEEKLPPEWEQMEHEVNKDTRRGVRASSVSEALRKFKK